MLQKKQTSSADRTPALLRLLAPTWKRLLVRLVAKRGFASKPFNFPLNKSSVHSILIVLSEQLKDALHCAGICSTVSSQFTRAKISLLCSSEIAGYMRAEVSPEQLLAFDSADCELFSHNLRQLGERLAREAFDLVLVLDTAVSDQTRYLLGKSGAPVRMGLAGACPRPFLNVRISNSKKVMPLTGPFSALLEATGISQADPVKWTADKWALQETDHLLREMHLDPKTPLIGVDGQWFAGCDSHQWVQELLLETSRLCGGAALVDITTGSALFTNDQLDKAGVRPAPFQSAAQHIALISRMSVVIAGDTAQFVLATHTGRPVVGFFKQETVSSQPHLVAIPAVECLFYSEHPFAITAQTLAQTITRVTQARQTRK